MSEPGNSNGSRSLLANVLIAVVIAVALACLIVPAIVAARHSARRLQCEYNIKVIGRSLRNFTELHQRFPRGTIANEQLPPESRLSWYPGVWPFVEGGYELLIDRQKAWNDPSNLASHARIRDYDEQNNEYDRTVDFQPELFCCPELDFHSRFANLTLTAYVGPSGLGQESLVSAETRPTDGIWGYDRSTALDQICDGIGNTVLLLETSVENGPWTAGGPPTVREIDETDQPAFGIGRQFGGLHSGITNVAFADGSMKPMNDDVDMTVLVELVTVCDSRD